jgi:WD40 repeat protein
LDPGDYKNIGAIRLYDFDSGQLVALLKGHINVVADLAFSPDGRHLISGSGDSTAIIWDVETRQPKHRLIGHRDQVVAVGFTPDSQRAVTGSFDGDLRLWRVEDGRQIVRMRGHVDRISSLDVARDGTIASGDYHGEIRLWDGITGAFRKVLARQTTWIGSLSFSPDGKLLLSSCGGGAPCADNPAIVYDVTNGGEATPYHGHDNVVDATAISPEGRWAATGGGDDRSIHIWDLRTGDRRVGLDGQPLRLTGTGKQVWAVGFAKDGREIAWGQSVGREHPFDRGPLEYSLVLPSSEKLLPTPRALDPNQARAFSRALVAKDGWSLTHRSDHRYNDAILDIKQGTRVVASIDRKFGGQHRAYSLTPDSTIVISGGVHGLLEAYDRGGKTLGTFIGHDGDIWAVAPSHDGQLLLSGGGDQTLRLWDLKAHKLLVTLFYGQDGEWVMWTPEGFFVASENGGKLVGWQINQGPDKEARYVTADQLKKLFYRPDLVAAKIAGDPEGTLREEAQRLDIDAILASGPAPEVAIVAPSDGNQADENKQNVTVRIADKGGGIGKITFRVNGQVKATARGRLVLNERNEITREFELARTENVIEVVASNGPDFLESEPATVTVKVDEGTLKGVPKLYVLAIGVDNYFDSGLRLEYAVKDALRLSKVLELAATSYGAKDFYRDAIVKTLPDKSLPDSKITRDKVRAAFEEIGGKMRATDVFVFFIAGHGKTVKGDYYFLPPNFRNIGLKPIEAQGFGPDDWEKWTAMITAEKSLLIYDTCESGSLATGEQKLAVRRSGDHIAAYQRLKERTGRLTLMATRDSDIALEGYRKKHGILTYAILEAIAKADPNQDNQIGLTELLEYVGDRVPEISCELTQPEPGSKGTCYRQVPQASFDGSLFPISPRFEAANPDYEAIAATASEIGQPAPDKLTHVVIQPVDLLEAIGGKVLRQLPTGYRVTEVRLENGFVLIARDGNTIGYVEESKLAELK